MSAIGYGDDVTEVEEALVELQEATDRLDRAEVELKSSRERFVTQVREAWSGGASIFQIQEITGFSRGHVYDLLGDLTRPHSETRRARRKRIQGDPA